MIVMVETVNIVALIQTGHTKAADMFAGRATIKFLIQA